MTFTFSEKQVFALSLALGGLFCFIFFYSLWDWRQDWQLAKTLPPANPVTVKQNDTALMIAALPDEHLFGKAFSKMGEMPITNLQLRVTGIVKIETAENADISKAYISIAGQPSKIYQVGDSLPYGVKVYAITSHAVILENDGHLEKLPLPRNSLQFKAKPVQP